MKLGISMSKEKKHDARAKLFLTFSSLSLSSLLKLFIVVIQNLCYHGDVMAHFSSL